MQIVICDDEKKIQELLAEKVQKLYPTAEVILFASGQELLWSDKDPDILLLDIGMPGKNGMETAKEFRRRHKKTILIFVTAFAEYVFQAFDVGAFHYLVKPFTDEKFLEVLQSAVKQYEGRDYLHEKGTPPFMILSGGEHIMIKPEEIIYAEVFNRKILLHTIDSDIEYYGKMKELEKQVGENFYRSHRSYLVNFAFIRKYAVKTIYLEKGQALMSKKSYHEFVKCYHRYHQKRGKQ